MNYRPETSGNYGSHFSTFQAILEVRNDSCPTSAVPPEKSLSVESISTSRLKGLLAILPSECCPTLKSAKRSRANLSFWGEDAVLLDEREARVPSLNHRFIWALRDLHTDLDMNVSDKREAGRAQAH